MDETRRPSRQMREERVITVDDLEVREEGDTGHVITGHPLVYGVWSEDLGGFTERIMPGAAAKTILENDIRALFNHDPNYVLGRNMAGTLELSEQARGLRMRATPPATTWADDLMVSMKRHDIDQMSFAFRVAGNSWNSRDGGKPPQNTGEVWNEDYTRREIHQLVMYDVSVVTFAAYTQTDATARMQPGLLDGLGLDWAALGACLTRSERRLPLTDSDIDLLRGSIALLQSHIPPERVPEPEQVSAPLLPQLRMLLELEAASA